MAPHEQIRLELAEGAPGENVIAYFAPNAETNRSFDNDLVSEGLPGEDSSPLVLDFAQWTGEVTLQGHFETTATGGMPEAQRAAILALDTWEHPVSARDQFNRLISMVVFENSGPYHLFDEGDEYVATTQAGIDVREGTYPAVSVAQIQPGLNSGETRMDYTVKFQLGVEG